MEEQLLQRARILYKQGRNKEASEIYEKVVAMSPGDALIMAEFSEVLSSLDRHEEALEMINKALAIAPDFAPIYYIKATILLPLKKYDEAEQNLVTFRTMEPDDSDGPATMGMLQLMRKNWDEALMLADAALELEPDHLNALNVRSTALLKLGRAEDSFSTIESALNEDPDHPYTHANYGWSLLEKGDHKKALEHFREALRIDPNFQLAQAGMVEGLKSRYFIYRAFMKYSFWMGNMAEKGQWGFIIGAYIAYRGLLWVSETYPALGVFIAPLLFVYIVFALSTWILGPISNLMFRLNPYGKYLLDEEELKTTNFVGASVLVFIIGCIGWLVFRTDPWMVMAGYGFLMLMPLGRLFHNKASLIVSAVMGTIGLGAVVMAFTTGIAFNMLSIGFIIAVIGYQWLANFILIKEDNI